jgi:SAM-dependent methyltransferase
VNDKVPCHGVAERRAQLRRQATVVAPSPLYETVAVDLRAAYDGSAEARSLSERAPWQLRERDMFLSRLQSEGSCSLVEIGAGAGHDSRYFADNGLAVVATDLSPGMVEMCRRHGLNAHVMDVLTLDLPIGAFDAAYTMNSLLHVPNLDLPRAMAAIRRALKPGALFYLGVYGGRKTFEGVLPSDWHVPPRFFSFRTDMQLLAAAEPHFHVEDFHVVEDDCYFQALTLRAVA